MKNYEAYKMNIILFSGEAWTDVVTSSGTEMKIQAAAKADEALAAYEYDVYS